MKDADLIAIAFVIGTLGGGFVTFMIMSDLSNELQTAFTQQLAELETEYAARYKIEDNLIDECVADGLKRYECFRDLRICK